MFNKKTIFAVIIITAFLLIAPKFFGITAKNKLIKIQKIVAATPLYQMEILDYKQGWFTSKAKIKLKADFRRMLKDIPLKYLDLPAELTFDVDITHGPIMIHDGIHFGLVTMQSSFHPKIYKSDFNFKLVRHLSFFGNNEIKFSSDKVKFMLNSKEEVIIDAFDYTATLNEKYDHYSTTLSNFNISIKTKDGRFAILKNLSLTSEGDKINDYLWTGAAKVAIERINAKTREGRGEDINIDNIEYTLNLEKENKDNLKLAFNFNVEDVVLPKFNLNKFDYSISINKISLKTITEYFKTLTAKETFDFLEAPRLIAKILNQELPNAAEKLTLKHLDTKKYFNVDNLKYEMHPDRGRDFRFKTSLSFSKIGFAYFPYKIQDYKHSISLNQSSQMKAMSLFETIGSWQYEKEDLPLYEVFMMAMVGITQRFPEFNVNQLEFKIDDGYFKGNLISSVRIEESSEQRDFFTTNNGEILFNKELLQIIMEQKMRKPPLMDKEHYNKMIAEETSAVIGLALKQKHFVKEEDFYKMIVEFKNETFFINGKKAREIDWLELIF